MKSILYFFVLLTFSFNSFAKEATNSEPSVDSLPLDELAALADAYAVIKKSYVKDLSDQSILDGAIKGMLQNLDPHSQFLTSSDFDNLQKNSLGEYAGIGIKADHLEEGIIVRHIFKNSPAEKSKLSLGDNIIAVNDQSTLGLSVAEGGALMQGKIGTEIKLTIISEGSNTEDDIFLVRRRIEVSTITSELLTDNIGYIRIEEFQALSERHLSQAIFSLEKNGALNALILDLRNNPGGLLDSAIAVSDLFLNEGVIVSTKGRLEESNVQYSATHGDILRARPLVLLINKNSASASEIVAGALQDHKRAYLIGNRSYGKGSVQTTLPIHGGAALKLTTALYYTPSDRSIHEVGIEPDLNIDTDATQTKPAHEIQIAEDTQLVAALNYIEQIIAKKMPLVPLVLK